MWEILVKLSIISKLRRNNSKQIRNDIRLNETKTLEQTGEIRSSSTKGYCAVKQTRRPLKQNLTRQERQVMNDIRADKSI